MSLKTTTSSGITLRPMTAQDCGPLSEAFEAQGWPSRLAQLQSYVFEARSGKVDAIVAEWRGAYAGYVTIRWESFYPPFKTAGIPEIMDLNVLKAYQRRGIATAMMDEAEARIARVSTVAGLGVGLTTDYGNAQRLYVRRGYIPDGRGMSQNEIFPKWGDQIRVDDNLVICLTKKLSSPGKA